MKAVLKKIFLFLAATALLLYISAGTAYLTYSLHLKGSPLFYASEALEIAVFACVVPFAREAALRVGIKSAFLLFLLFLLSGVYAVATAVGGVLLIELLLPVLN